MLVGHAVGGSLSNKRTMSRSILASVRATESEELIRSNVSDHH
jgi:hypothetical protein